MIVFLTEEQSMAATLGQIVPKIWPEGIEGVDWLALSFQGKQDLVKNIVRKMEGWAFGDPHFIILHDQDRDDCQKLKSNLSEIALRGRQPFHIRIVCQELESWFLGDLEAVEKAWPGCKASNLAEKARFRDPDQIQNPSRDLENLIGVSGKIGRAEAIARHLDLDRNRSNSFRVLISTVRSLSPG